MNIALIFAGGTGQRMNSGTKPKQFLELNGKPILLHTLEHFEKHNEIDSIAIVCLEGWIHTLRELLENSYIKKVRWIVPGGENTQDSVWHGLKAIQSDLEIKKDDIVLIHDGVRPLIDEQLITDNIKMVKLKGNAVSVSLATETIVSIDDKEEISEIANRKNARIAKAPQSFYFNDIIKAHELAGNDGCSFVDSASLMRHYGYELHTVPCSNSNIKITAASDFFIFRALYEAKETYQILGL